MINSVTGVVESVKGGAAKVSFLINGLTIPAPSEYPVKTLKATRGVATAQQEAPSGAVPMRELCLSALGSGPMTTSALAKCVGKPTAAVFSTVNSLTKDGIVKRAESGDGALLWELDRKEGSC